MSAINYTLFGTVLAAIGFLWLSGATRKRHVYNLIQGMAEEGYEFCCGHHVIAMKGYYAGFHQNADRETCPACDQYERADWSLYGHALELDEAVVMGAEIARGKAVAPTSKEFE